MNQDFESIIIDDEPSASQEQFHKWIEQFDERICSKFSLDRIIVIRSRLHNFDECGEGLKK